MTRETKIGLLVGLAFVIMTGILLSNYLSSTNEPGAAPLKVAGDTLRSGLGEPGNDDVAPVLRAPSVITPSQPVVITAELNHRDAQPPVRFVERSSTSPQRSAITPTAPTNPSVTISQRLRQAAEQNGEQLVAVGPGAVIPPINPAAPADPQPSPAPAKLVARTYQAQPGDSLGLIARKAYGSGCKANRDAIVAANPSLAENRDLVVAGESYVIPLLGNSRNKLVSVATPAVPAAEAPAVDKSVVYVVQPNDTLWSIAMDQVGTSSAVAAIEALNESVLNGSDRVRPNMKLKLPAKAD